MCYFAFARSLGCGFFVHGCTYPWLSGMNGTTVYPALHGKEKASPRRHGVTEEKRQKKKAKRQMFSK
jgi:hypothetical protein